jgi:hypothetical protein
MPHLLQDLARFGPLRSLAGWLRGRRGKRGRKKSREKDKPERSAEEFVEAARQAESLGDARAMYELSYKLIRHERYERAWQLRKAVAELAQPAPIPHWDGGDLTGRTILIRPFVPKNRVGEELRLSRFIASVTKAAKSCIVLTEARLVPLFRRSFGIDARVRGADDAASIAEADIVATYEGIALHHARDAEEMRRSFVPLRPDPERVAAIRQKYRRVARGPLIGISWWSSNEKKELPDVEDWAPLLGWDKASFVCLQYGDISKERPTLDRLAGGRMIYDAEIDQIADMDGFAAQISALDAVVSISNTTIDTAGMLGVPTLHIRPDKPSAIWPSSGPSPWYPGMTFLYRQRRPWAEVLVEARQHLERKLATPEAASAPNTA